MIILKNSKEKVRELVKWNASKIALVEIVRISDPVSINNRYI